jgi:hypothetical protein
MKYPYRPEKYEAVVLEDTVKIEEPVDTWPKPDYSCDKSAIRAEVLWEL